MSIFRKASDLNSIPKAINNAYFDDVDFNSVDEFDSLLKEASEVANKTTYANRVKNYTETQSKNHEFQKPEPARYAEIEGGIRRAGYGQRFNDEYSETFGAEKIRSIQFDNNKYAESLLNNGLSIWEPEFDEIQSAFSESQKQSDEIFDRKSLAEKRVASNNSWQAEQLQNIRKANVLPYRGLGISRLANETPIHHGNFNSVNDFYAEAQDSIRGMIKESNANRKAQIERKGIDPEERRSQWENKESISARTMESLSKSSFLSKFAEDLSLND